MADNLQAMAEASAREAAGLRRLVIVTFDRGNRNGVRRHLADPGAGARARAGAAPANGSDRRSRPPTAGHGARARGAGPANRGLADRADRAVQGLDAEIDAAGDRIADRAVQRMQQEMPGFLDHYFRSRLPR